MAQQQQQCRLCEKPLAGSRFSSLTAGCCKAIFHEKCIASYCCEQGRAEPGGCPSCGAPVRKLVADNEIQLASSSSSSSSLAARRIKYGRQDYHLFVERPATSSNGGTLMRCSALFDVAPARVKLFAGGRALTTEAEVEAAAAGGAPILCVGTRRTNIIRTETTPRRAMIRVKRVFTAAWVALKPACHAIVMRLPIEAAAGAVSPWLSHAWWCGDVFLRSIDPSWKNPYKEDFDRRRSAREARELAGWGGGGVGEHETAVEPRAVPDRQQDPGRGPHQFR